MVLLEYRLYTVFSSMSSCLNSAAAVTWQDIIQIYGLQFSEAKKTLITKFLGNYLIHD